MIRLILLLSFFLVTIQSVSVTAQTLDSTTVRLSTEVKTTPVEAIASVLRKMISGDIASGKIAAQKALPLCNGETPDAVAGRKLINYILGKEKISDDALFMGTEKDEAICALAFLAMFIRKVENKKTADKSLMISNLENYASNAKGSENKDAMFWVKRVSAWKEWVRSDFSRKPGLEKFFSLNSSFEQLADVPKLDFVIHHNSLKDRPKLKSVSYDEKIVTDYLNKIKDLQVKRAENRRYGCIRQVPEYVTALLARNTYSGKIYLKNSTPFQGMILRANENMVSVKRGSGTRGKSSTYKWEDFKLEQFADIMGHFAAIREKASTREGAAKQRLDAGEDLLLMAVLFDLAGEPEKAYDAAVKAEKMSPTIAKKIKKVFCDSIPSEDDTEEK